MNFSTILELIAVVTAYEFIVLGINEVWVKPYAMKITRVLSIELLGNTLALMDEWLIRGDFEVGDWHQFIGNAIALTSGDQGWLESPRLNTAIEEVASAFDPRVFGAKATEASQN